MTVDPRVKELPLVLDNHTPTRELLAHARREADRYNLGDYFVVDVDSHREPTANWSEVIEYIENPVIRRNSKVHHERDPKRPAYVNAASPVGFNWQSMFGRVAHEANQQFEPVTGASLDREVELAARAMDAMGIDRQIIFPTVLLGMGMSPVAEAEAQIAYAYNRWFIDRVCPSEPRIKFMPYLPLRSPEMCVRIIKETAGLPGVVGFLVTSVRYDPVWSNNLMPIYAAIEETGLPLGFHAGPTWDDQWMRSMNRFISMHAISFVHANIVHLTNWIINGLPERFPKLKVVWIESGLAWVPFLMQRLDSEYLKRSSEAPLLTRLPSEYMRDMYYTSQPMERDDFMLLEATFKAINAGSQLLYASDWPHWDFDLPSSILELPFVSDQDKRNILGENARDLFKL